MLSAVTVCLGLTVFLASAVIAQDDVTNQLWVDYHASFHTSEKLEFHGDTGVRFASPPDEFFRFYIRPSLRHHYSERWRFLVGLGAFATDNIGAENTLEIRPWEGVRLKWPTLGPITVNNLVRFEQRIKFSSNESGAAFQLRFRYQLGTSIPLMREPWQGFFIPVSAEWFWDAGDDVDRFADDLRLSAGLGYEISETWIVNFLLTIERSRSTSDSSFTTADVIFRFQIKHLLSKRDFRKRIETPGS